MSFSASPLVPGQAGSPDAENSAESRVVETVLEAARQALAQIPSAETLTVGEPVLDIGSLAWPDSATTAVTGFLGGAVEGKVLLIVGSDLTQALADTPFGSLEPAQALKPALETFADALGGRLDSEPASIAVEECTDVLAGGPAVVVPLLGENGPVSYLAAGFSSLESFGPATPGAGSSGATAARTAEAARSWGIDMLRDVEMEVTCELGRTRMTVRRLLALAPGDVVELDRLAGAPADLLVNGTLLARGEVVVVDESFGLRITEIVTRDAT